jgi:hypothetical protein
VRLQQANRHRHPAAFCIYCFCLPAAISSRRLLFCFENFCLMGTWGPFVLQVQTARMAQGESHLLGVASYNSRQQTWFQTVRIAKVWWCHSAAQGTRRPLVLGCWERAEEAPAGVRGSKRKGSSGTCLACFVRCATFTKREQILTYVQARSNNDDELKCERNKTARDYCPAHSLFFLL